MAISSPKSCIVVTTYNVHLWISFEFCYIFSGSGQKIYHHHSLCEFYFTDWAEREKLFKQSITAHLKEIHAQANFIVIASQANYSSLSDSGNHFHFSGSSSAHIFIAINIPIITSAIAVLWHRELLQLRFRSGYGYLDERGPLLPLTWGPVPGPPEFQQKLFKQSCSRAH